MAKTHMERMGFQDPEIGTPEHDELVIWTEQHAPAWIRKHIETPSDGWTEAREKLLADARKRIERERKSRAEYNKWLNHDNPDQLQGWEKQCHERSLREAAVIDEQIRLIEQEIQSIPGAKPPLAPEFLLEMEHLLTSERGYALGYLDLKATVRYPCYGVWEHKGPYANDRQPSRLENFTTTRHAAFEAKIRIPSLGELLRQLRFYQGNWRRYEPGPFSGNPWIDVPYVVVSRDDHYRSLIEKQGFSFWNPKDF